MIYRFFGVIWSCNLLNIRIEKHLKNSIYFTEATTITPLDMASAEELKDQGNKAFTLKEYKKAAKIYRDAIQIDTYNPILYSNRAQCFLHLQDYDRAYKDCVSGINWINSSNHNKGSTAVLVKLQYRKGMALKGLQKWNSAKEAFEKVLQLDPSNQAAKTELNKLPIEDKMDVDIKIPIEKVEKLPEKFSKMIQSPPSIEKKPVKEPEVTAAATKEIEDLFGSSKKPEITKISEVRHKPHSSIKDNSDSTPPVMLLPMHFLTTLKQLPEEQKLNGYKYILNIDNQSYADIFSSGIDTEFLQFYLDAASYVSTNDSLPNWNQVVLNHLKQFSTFKRFDLSLLMCDDKSKKAILQNIKDKFPKDLSEFQKYIS